MGQGGAGGVCQWARVSTGAVEAERIVYIAQLYVLQSP